MLDVQHIPQPPTGFSPLKNATLVGFNERALQNKPTWRIIPASKLVNDLPNGLPWLINGGDPNYLQVLGWFSKYLQSWNLWKQLHFWGEAKTLPKPSVVDS